MLVSDLRGSAINLGLHPVASRLTDELSRHAGCHPVREIIQVQLYRAILRHGSLYEMLAGRAPVVKRRESRQVTMRRSELRQQTAAEGPKAFVIVSYGPLPNLLERSLHCLTFKLNISLRA